MGFAATAAPAGTLLPPCPTLTAPAPSPQPPLPHGAPGIGARGGRVQSITETPGSEQVVAAAAGEGQAGLILRGESGSLFVVLLSSRTPIRIGSGRAAALAFGPGQVAVLRAEGGRLALRAAAAVVDLASAPDMSVDWPAGDDLAARYGPEGWLHAASGGSLWRLNPFAQQWEPEGRYAGSAQQLVRTASGVLLLGTTSGLYRRVPDGSWQSTRTPGGSLAVRGDEAALAWLEGGAWRIALSADAGASWQGGETVWFPGQGTLGQPYPVFDAEATLEVVGVYVQPGAGGFAAYPYPVIVQRTAEGWYPEAGGHPEPIAAEAANLLPAGRFLALSEQAVSFAVWEGRQSNGSTDVFAVFR